MIYIDLYSDPTDEMNRQLILLRHAKSDWSLSSRQDYDRPLSGRGMVDAVRIGQWLKTNEYIPDHVISSPALRAWQTTEAVCNSLPISAKNIHYDRNIYMAERDDLLKVIENISGDCVKVLLVGHNPGLDDLLIYLAADKLKLTTNGKLLTTAAAAILSVSGDWKNLSAHSGSLLDMVRPKEL